MPEFGLALGGGGVKGLAHIALLKKLDQLGAKPAVIAGTSIGAIIGALYAAGISGEEIETRVRAHILTRQDNLKSAYQRRAHLVKWVKVFAFERNRGGLFTAQGLFEHLFTEIKDMQFDDLQIPFVAIATDFHRGEEIPLNQGNLLTAVTASMAVPGVFAPVTIDERLLVDGGLVNNVPCDYVTAAGRKVIASDVICLSTKGTPKTTQIIAGAMSIMLRAATERKFADCPPDFVLHVDTEDIDSFDFRKINKVLKRGDEAVAKASAQLERLLAD